MSEQSFLPTALLPILGVLELSFVIWFVYRERTRRRRQTEREIAVVCVKTGPIVRSQAQKDVAGRGNTTEAI